MRVIFTQHITHHAGGFNVLAGAAQSHLAHRKQDTALYRFLPVADIGQGAAFYYRDGIFEIGALGIHGNRHFVAIRQRWKGGKLSIAAGTAARGVLCLVFKHFSVQVLIIRKQDRLPVFFLVNRHA